MSTFDSEVRELAWRKASRSANNGECVEVAPAQGYVAIRDSKNPESAILGCPPDMFQSFLAATKRGDLLP
jgi:Domain of unknown function (DUF397)